MPKTVGYGEGRDLLVSATVKVVADRGLRGFTLRAVAEHVGVSNGLVAHHFGTRESLLGAALDWSVEQSIESTGLLDLSSEDRFVDALVESISVRPELQAFQYEMILEARRNPVFAPPVARLYSRYHAVVQESLERAGFETDLQDAARGLFATLDGLVLQSIAGVPVVLIRGAAHQVWKSLPGMVSINR